MHQLKTAIRLALCVGLIASAAVWVALAVGVLENPAVRAAKHRVMVAKYVSVVASSLISSRRDSQLENALKQFVAQEPELISAGIRSVRGSLVSAGPHELTWKATVAPAQKGKLDSKPTSIEPNQISAELLANDRLYGTIELAFRPAPAGLWQILFGFPVPLAIFIGSFVSIGSWLIFERSFKYLDPSQVVPDRVRSALDVMAEGLVLLDIDNEIGHANDAFERIVCAEPRSLLGKSIDDFRWAQSSDYGGKELPWTQSLAEQQPVCGVVVDLIVKSQPTRKFIVNATPIVSDQDECRGVLVSFEDVTALEDKKHELSQIIKTLRQSRDEVERQNNKLNFLASYDQLTECLNRREFFKQIEESWNDEDIESLAVIMMDIDHFKSVNDNHGHGVGDEVLRGIGKVLRDCIGDRGTVARLGGEEFVVLLPHIDIGPATLIAEEIRLSVRSTPLGGLNVTISVGVSSREMKPMDPQHLLDQADQALYSAKNSGRDRVVRFDERDESEPSLPESQLTKLAEVEKLKVGDSHADAIVQEVEALIEISREQKNRSFVLRSVVR